MVDFRAELAALVAAYDEHGGRWPQEDEEALCQAVEHARAVLDRGDAAGSPAGAAATAAVAAAIAAGQPVTLPSGTVIADPAWFESRIAIRAVLAQPEPAPVADGEVAELVTWLRREACFDSQWAASAWAPRLNRAADLLERQAAAAPVARLPEDAQVIEPANRTILVPVRAPIPVSERLPGPSVKVLAHYFNDLGKGQTICAIWVPAKTRSDSYGDDDFTEYDEASDTFYWPEGWYEAIENWDDLGYVKVDEGEVTYWQPLPKWPAHALPLPEVNDD